MTGSFLLLGIVLPWLAVALVVAVGAWIGFQLIQQNGRMLGRLEALEQLLGQRQSLPMPPSAQPTAALAPAPPAGLPMGSPAPDFALPNLNGKRKSLADFRGQKLLTIFFNPRCGFCSQMAPDLALLSVEGKDSKPIPLVLTTGDPEETRKLFAQHGINCPVLVQEAMEVAAQYQCGGTPMGYLIDEQGNIASDMATGAQALIALVDAPPATAHGNGALAGKRTLADSKIQRHGLTVGTPAPSFTLPRLDEGELSLEEFRGRKVLLVFSDPKCGPCMALAPQLERQHRASADAQVLMVSRGEVEANREKVEEHGLTYPIVLQQQWEVSRDYAMFATPVAYLIDENGVIAAEVATGVEAILALLDSVAALKAPARRCKCGKLQGECGKSDCECQRQKTKPTVARWNGKQATGMESGER